MLNLKEKVAIITGASSGIGASTAVEFARLECKLVLSGRNIENLNKTKENCIAAGKLQDGDVLVVKADMTEHMQLEEIVQETVKHFGKIDILVNSAAILIYGSGAGTDPIEDFDEIMNTNVRGLIQLTQMCLPHLKKSKGSVINVSSIYATCPMEKLLNEAYPLGRIGEPEEVAKTIVFLASNDSSFITGQNLNVCGGITIKVAGPREMSDL